MARYAYDVNTTQRLIDVHKQFSGGLKTVDTDDALGAVFLRQAENVSLSEFGFIEKRYGTFENFKLQNNINVLQGYWEFNGKIIYAADGNLYIDNQKVKKLKQRPNLRYPDTSILEGFEGEEVDGACVFVYPPDGLKLDVYSTTDPSQVPSSFNGKTFTPNNCQEGGVYYRNCEQDPFDDTLFKCEVITTRIEKTFEITTMFQKTRDVNAVNVNGTLYIFTGTYPIYVDKNFDTYMFPIKAPIYDEVAVTGHNLLEYDYEEIYGFDTTSQLRQAGIPEIFQDTTNFKIVESNYLPKIPYVDSGINFEFDYRVSNKYAGRDFEKDSENKRRFTRIDLKSLKYIYSGSNATVADALPIDRREIDFKPVANYNGIKSVIFEAEKPFVKSFEQTDLLVDENNSAVYSSQTVEGYFMYSEQPVDPANLNPTTYSSTNARDINEHHINTYNTEFTKNISKDEVKPGYGFLFSFYNTTEGEDTSSSKITLTKDNEVFQRLLGINDSRTFLDDNEDSPEKINPNLIYGPTKDKFYNRPSPWVYSTDDYSVNFYGTEQYKDTFSKDTLSVTAECILYPVTPSGFVLSNSRTTIPITEENLRKKQIEIIIPKGIADGDNIASYNITLKLSISFRYEDAYDFTTFKDKIGISFVPAEIISKESANYILSAGTTPSINFKLNSLLPGNFDFIATFDMKTFIQEEDGTLVLDEFFEEQVYFNDITVTPKKLVDYQRFIGDLQHPVWSCNKVIEHFGKLMIWGSEQMETAVFYSFPEDPSYFPSYFFLDFTNDEGSPVQSVSNYMNILVVQTEDRTWGVRGNSGIVTAPNPYVTFTINPTVGTIAYKSVRPVRNHLFFLSKQGVIVLKSLYAADEQYNIDFMDRNIRNIVPQDTEAVGIQYDNQYWLNFPNHRITLRWYIDKKAWVLDKFNAWSDFKGIFKFQLSNGKLEFITKPSQFNLGENASVYKIGIDYSLPTDLGKPIKSLFETSFLNQNYPFHPKNYKEAKLDFTLQNEYNLGRDAIYEMTTNEDISGSIHTMDINLKPNHRYRLEYVLNEEDEVILDGGTYDAISDDYETPAYSSYSYDDTLDLRFYTIIEFLRFGSKFVDLEEVDYQTVEFIVPNNYDTDGVIAKGDFTDYANGAYLRDVTYDDSLEFKTWVISENQTLNIDNAEGYDPEFANVGLDLSLKDRLGDWVFGESDFGNTVTAVKTIKLSGRGYNSKIYIEDLSKSKWTLESMGITYKMKRARSK